MKKMLFFCFMILCVIPSLSAQHPVMVRHAGHLRYEGFSNNIENQELSLILDENSFSQYRLARRENIAAIPLWGLAGAGFLVSTVWASIAFYDLANPSENIPGIEVTPAFPILFAISGITMGISLVPMIPALVLTIDSHTRLNKIARNYNHTVSLSPHLSPYGIGLTLKF